MALSDTDPAFLAALAADPFLRWHYRNAADPKLGEAGVEAKLVLLGKPLNNPTTNDQASVRMAPGTFNELLGPFFGLPRPGLLADLEWFLRQEELWRGYGTPPGTPAAFAVPKGVPDEAFEPDGTGPVLGGDQDGDGDLDPKPVRDWDTQHLTITQLACMASVFHAAGRNDLARRALFQVDSVMVDVCGSYANDPWSDDNQRALGWLIEALAIWIMRSPKTAWSRAIPLLNKVIDYLWAKHGTTKGAPFFTLNKAAAKDVNHKEPCSNWMGARITVGIDTLGSVLDWNADYFEQSRALLRHGGLCVDYAMELAASNGGPLGSAVDDYGPDGTFHWVKPAAYGVMDPFWWPAALACMRRFPSQFEVPFKEPLRVAYEHRDGMRWWDKNFGSHALSVCAPMALVYGWRKKSAQ